MEKNTARDLKIEWLPIDELKPDSRNPKQHSARQIKQIAESIKTFGNLVPVLIDRENKILAGHGRVLAAQRLGRTEVPVIRIEHLTSEEARAFSIADNRLTELSTWDERLLGEILGELSAIDLHFSLEVTGFSMAEIDLASSTRRSRQKASAIRLTKWRVPLANHQSLGPATCGGQEGTLFGAAMSLTRLPTKH